MMNCIMNVDNKIVEFIKGIHNPILDNIMVFITSLGDNGIIWIVLSLILIINKKYRAYGILLGISLIATSLLGEVILKNLFQRQRPFISNNLEIIISSPKSFSFPSGHTASIFACVGVFLFEIKKYRVPIITLACLIAFSRMYLFVHYFTDILGGVVLGLVISFAVVKVYNRFIKAKEELKMNL